MPTKNGHGAVQIKSEDDIPTFYLVVDDENHVVERNGEFVLDISTALSQTENDDSSSADSIGIAPSPSSTTNARTDKKHAATGDDNVEEFQEDNTAEEVFSASGAHLSSLVTANDKLLKHELDYFGDYVSSALKTLPPANAYGALASISRILLREKQAALMERKRKLSNDRS